MATQWLVAVSSIVALCAVGCSGGEGPSVGSATTGNTGSGATAGTAGQTGADGGSGGSTGTGTTGSAGSATSATSGGSATTTGFTPDGGGCAGRSEQAQGELLPIDVVWAIDTSGSMESSFPAIQQALNDFSTRVTDAGIDAHIVLLAGASQLCVPPPLGSGECGPAQAEGQPAPDSREPFLRHLDVPFGINQGVPVLLDSFPAYQDLLRPNARTHLVVTEDGFPLQTPQQVIDHVEGRASATLGAAWNPPLQPGQWIFHGVVCENGPGTGTCGILSLPPETTLTLIDQTGGLVGNLDEAGTGADPFGALLDELAERVIVGARVSCDYTIPEPPEGGTLDRDAVNVILVDGQGASTVFPRVPGDVECGDNLGWKYDDPENPTRVVLCPAACESAQGDPDARIDVQFGCETVVLL